MDKIVQDPLIKNQNLANLWIKSLESYKFVLTVCTSWCLPNILKSWRWPLAFTLHKAFLKTKIDLQLVSLPRFSHNFERKKILVLHFLKLPNFNAPLPLLLEILDNLCLVIICCPVCDVKNFEINLALRIKPFAYIFKTSQEKIQYLKNKKRF